MMETCPRHLLPDCFCQQSQQVPQATVPATAQATAARTNEVAELIAAAKGNPQTAATIASGLLSRGVGVAPVFHGLRAHFDLPITLLIFGAINEDAEE